jgi:Protein of unknown function (DUF1592)/Protein of unknown function (DUF1588)/Protein of unknown function (DUF1595)/Protein of unknown function (DUF1587)/Protein of unknown function (DUF1585)
MRRAHTRYEMAAFIRTLSVIGIAASCGCSGVFGLTDSKRPQQEGASQNVADLDPEQRAALCAAGAVPLAKAPVLVRLSFVQYDGVIQDLLGITDRPSLQFSPDPTVDGFSNYSASLAVSPQLARDFRTTAENLAQSITADSAKLSALLQCQPSAGVQCATSFINRFVARAYRRPLASQETANYLTLFNSASSVFDSGDVFTNGVRLVIEAALQSPSFLYRQAPAEGTSGVVTLTDVQVAEQLALTLWSGLPDDTLSQAASASLLHTPEQVRAQVQRMLASPKARRTLSKFHDEMFNLSLYTSIQKDPTRFPDFSTATIAAMQEEVRRFAEDIVFDTKGGVYDLFTAPFTYVNQETAPLYGLSGDFGPEMVRVDLNANERAGIVTQTGFLASHAHSRDTSPILRGVYVFRDLLCNGLGAPPADVVQTVPDATAALKTQRQRVQAITGSGSCNACHSNINPPGFALEAFDTLGRVQTTDNGEPIDTKVSMFIDGVATELNGPVELAQAMGASDQAARCYTTKLARFMLQRREADGDVCAIDDVSRGFATPGYTIADALTALSTTRAALNYTPMGDAR